MIKVSSNECAVCLEDFDHSGQPYMMNCVHIICRERVSKLQLQENKPGFNPADRNCAITWLEKSKSNFARWRVAVPYAVWIIEPIRWCRCSSETLSKKMKGKKLTVKQTNDEWMKSKVMKYLDFYNYTIPKNHNIFCIENHSLYVNIYSSSGQWCRWSTVDLT